MSYKKIVKILPTFLSQNNYQDEVVINLKSDHDAFELIKETRFYKLQFFSGINKLTTAIKLNGVIIY